MVKPCISIFLFVCSYNITMRAFVKFILSLVILGCQAKGSNIGFSETENQSFEPNYEVAIQFINDYLDYSNELKSEIGLIDWVTRRNDVTTDFKNELIRVLNEAEKNNSEHGLGFDPILDAQDSPNRFVINKTESEYLIVKGENWPEFELIIKVKLVDNKWIVDGSGIINIPVNKRIKR